MRTIKFRAKRLDNGEWVYGYVDATMYKDVVCIHSEATTYRVSPDTVGQYTGLTDKNGTKIFEGDCLTNVYLNPKNVTPLHIHFDEYCACYRAGRFQIDKNCCLNYTIIGNIFDNPELLK